jgi:hypothetical protein
MKLVDNLREDNMTANEPQQPAMVAGIGHMGNVGLVHVYENTPQ